MFQIGVQQRLYLSICKRGMSWESVSYFCIESFLFSDLKYGVIFMCTDDIDTRAITRRLREDGSLIGALTTDSSKTDEELIHAAKTWEIVGNSLSG